MHCPAPDLAIHNARCWPREQVQSSSMLCMTRKQRTLCRFDDYVCKVKALGCTCGGSSQVCKKAQQYTWCVAVRKNHCAVRLARFCCNKAQCSLQRDRTGRLYLSATSNNPELLVVGREDFNAGLQKTSRLGTIRHSAEQALRSTIPKLWLVANAILWQKP